MANIPISSLTPFVGSLPAGTFFEISTPNPLSSTGFDSYRATPAQIGGASLEALGTFVTVTDEVLALPSSRRLAAQLGVTTLTDAGAGSTLTIGIATNGIANSLLAQVAQSTIKGRAAGLGTGDVQDLTAIPSGFPWTSPALITGDNAKLTIYDTATYATSVGGILDLDFKNASGTQVDGVRLEARATAGGAGTEVADFVIATMRTGTLADAVWVKGVGDVGIGTSDPSTYISGFTAGANGLAIADATAAVLALVDTTDTVNNIGWVAQIETDLYLYGKAAAGKIIIGANNGAAPTYFDAAGNIGLNTNAPATYINGFTGGARGIAILDEDASVVALVDSSDTTNFISWVAQSGGTFYILNKAAGGSLDLGTANTQSQVVIAPTGAVTAVSTVTAAAFIPSGSSAPTNGLYLPAANTLGLAVSSAGEVQLTATAWSPMSDGGNALGTTALGWNGAHLSTGTAINWANGNVTLTQASNTLTVGGSTLASLVFRVTSTLDATAYNSAGVRLDCGLGVAGAIFGNSNILAATDIGVGTTSPSTYITGFTAGANGIAVADATAAVVALVDTTDTTNYIGWFVQQEATLYLLNKASGSIDFGTANTSGRMVLTTNGNLGIGTTTPGTYITGFTGNSGGIAIADETAAVLALVDTTDTTNNITWFAQNNADLYILNKAPTGTVQIGTANTTRATFSSAGLLRLHAYGAGTLTTDASGNVTAVSDADLKIHRSWFDRTIRDVLDVRPRLHGWNEKSGMDDGTYVGFFAQDYEAGVPEAIGRDPRGYRTFSDRAVLAVLHNTAVEHERRIAEIEREYHARR